MTGRLAAWAANLFPVWVLLAGALALIEPSWFSWFRGSWIVWGLTAVMLGMGATLSWDDFAAIRHMPKAVALGFVLQYTVMPSLGWAIGHLLGLPTPFAVGLILVACCPGGTASNIVTFLAGANVALSVTMTALSTLAAVIMTPWLTGLLAGTLVRVDGWGLVMSTFQVVILPVAAGLAIHRWLPRLTRAVLPVAPAFSALMVAMICAAIIAQNAAAIRSSGLHLLTAVILLHSGGFLLGYLGALLGRLDIPARRTVSIEVGMQNSGLGVVLAQRHFPDPLTAVPCAISSVVHSVIGSLLAGWWRWRLTSPKTASRPATSASSDHSR